MDILIVSATQFEIQPLLDFLKITSPQTGLSRSSKNLNGLNVSVLISGIGMVNTAYAMGRYAHLFNDTVINAGACGAFDSSLQLGEVVHVVEDTLSEMGAENGDDFLPYATLHLPGETQFRGRLESRFECINGLKKVKGITVNTIHGHEPSINKVKQLYAPDVESMEGAAFLACCHTTCKNTLQLRAISNYVEKRDKSKWQMTEAIKHLNDFLINFMTELSLTPFQ